MSDPAKLVTETARYIRAVLDAAPPGDEKADRIMEELMRERTRTVIRRPLVRRRSE